MIQGHVDFDKSCYLRSQFEFLHDNILRELKEEIDTTMYLEVPQYPKYYFSGNNTLSQLEHFGIVYEIKVPNVRIMDIKSGEPDKHDIIYLKLSDLKKYENKLDDWSIVIINDIIENEPKRLDFFGEQDINLYY
jgi:predicted NUDIX family phosphoesterase